MVVQTMILNSVRADIISDLGTAITHIAVGSDNTTPTTSDTALGSEDIREATFSENSTSISFAAALFLDTADNNGNTINEIGCFDDASAGNMYNRSLTNSIAKTATIEVFAEVKFEVSVGN